MTSCGILETTHNSCEILETTHLANSLEIGASIH